MGGYASAIRFKPNTSNNHMFTVSKATGTKFTQFTPTNVPSMQVKVFSTIKQNDPPQMIDFQKSLFKQPKVDGGGSLAKWAIRCLFPSFQPNPISKKIMAMFGFNPGDGGRVPDSHHSPNRSGGTNGHGCLPEKGIDFHRLDRFEQVWKRRFAFLRGGGKLRQHPCHFGYDGSANRNGSREGHVSLGCVYAMGRLHDGGRRSDPVEQ